MVEKLVNINLNGNNIDLYANNGNIVALASDIAKSIGYDVSSANKLVKRYCNEENTNKIRLLRNNTSVTALVINKKGVKDILKKYRNNGKGYTDEKMKMMTEELEKKW